MPKTRKSSHCKKRYTRTHKHVRKTRSHARKTRRALRMRGGRSDKPTVRTVEGIPVTEDAVVSIPGVGSFGLNAFKSHEVDMDFQGEEQSAP